MTCSSCGQRRTIHYVRFKDGTRRRYDDAPTAKAVAAKTDGAEYEEMKR